MVRIRVRISVMNAKHGWSVTPTAQMRNGPINYNYFACCAWV